MLLTPYLKRLLMSALLLSFTGYVQAAVCINPDVKALIAAKEAPEGVVFDVETLNPNALQSISEYLVNQVNALKKSYPDVDIAVVSHGTEEFALQNRVSRKNAELHRVLGQMVTDKDVSLHVCGAVAGLKRVSQQDFPSFVSYSESGAAQINDYTSLGYEVIVIRQLSDLERRQLFSQPWQFIK